MTFLTRWAQSNCTSVFEWRERDAEVLLHSYETSIFVVLFIFSFLSFLNEVQRFDNGFAIIYTRQWHRWLRFEFLFSWLRLSLAFTAMLIRQFDWISDNYRSKNRNVHDWLLNSHKCPKIEKRFIIESYPAWHSVLMACFLWRGKRSKLRLNSYVSHAHAHAQTHSKFITHYAFVPISSKLCWPMIRDLYAKDAININSNRPLRPRIQSTFVETKQEKS